jgi:hypothetical protein
MKFDFLFLLGLAASFILTILPNWQQQLEHTLNSYIKEQGNKLWHVKV